MIAHDIKDMGKDEQFSIAGRSVNCMVTVEGSVMVPWEARILGTQDAAKLFLGIYPKVPVPYYKNTYSSFFINAIFIKDRN